MSILPAPLKKKTEDLSRFIDFKRMIDKGNNGYVLIGFNTLLQQEVVVKFYYWGEGDHAEPARLAQMDSEHILSILHAESINDDDAFFITPYCAAGDLDDALSARRFGPVQCVDALLQIAGVQVFYMEMDTFTVT